MRSGFRGGKPPQTARSLQRVQRPEDARKQLRVGGIGFKSHEVPIEFIGVGEKVEDLKAFDTETFVQALFEAPEELEPSAEAANAS